MTFAFLEPVVAFGAFITGADPTVPGSLSVSFGSPFESAFGSVIGNEFRSFFPVDGVPGGGAQFLGFTDPTGEGFTSVTFLVSPEEGVNTDAISIDDVSWVAVPEPSTSFLLVAAAFVCARRRR